MYPPEIQAVIAEKLTRQSLRRICSEEGMPDRTTVERWMQQDADFAAKCAHARVIQAEHEFDGMEDIEDGVLDGSIDPVAARVVLASKQWRLAKIASKKYGDKVETTLNGEIGVRHIERRIIDSKH